jgi:hypothetical protein
LPPGFVLLVEPVSTLWPPLLRIHRPGKTLLSLSFTLAYQPSPSIFSLCLGTFAFANAAARRTVV